MNFHRLVAATIIARALGLLGGIDRDEDNERR